MSKKETRERVYTRVAKVTAERLKHDANRRGLTVSKLLNSIVEERYGLRGKCPSEVFRGTFYSCVWGRQKTTPKILKLAETVQEKNDVCRACQRTLEMVMRSETAEIKLKEIMAEDIEISYPVCTAGAESRETENGDNTDIEFYCMHGDYGVGHWRNVDTFCNKIDRGHKCQGLVYNQITVQRTNKNMK